MKPHTPALTPLNDRRAALGRGAVLLAIVGVYAAMVFHFNWLVDDAFIAFRYSRNLAEGHGLRYNLAENPPVEGYSDLLWVLILTPFEMLHADVPAAARLLSAGCGLLLLGCVWRHARRNRTNGFIPAALALAWLAASPAMAAWSTSGLETMPFALLLFLTFDLLLGDETRPRGAAAGLAGIGMVLLRTEGWVWAVVLLCLGLLRLWRNKDRAALRRALLRYGLLVAVAAVGVLVWRMSYYGKPVSNTVYTKVAPSAESARRGLEYLARHMVAFPATVAILVGATITLWRRDAVARGLVLLALFVCATCVAAGGDWMPMTRLIVPALPLTAALAARLYQACWPRIAFRAPLALAACGMIALEAAPAFNKEVIASPKWSSGQTGEPMCEIWRHRRDRARMLIHIGRGLGLHTQSGDSLVIGAIGAAGYYAPWLHIYDCFGLVDPDIASRPFRVGDVPGHQRAVRMSFFDDKRATVFDAVLATGAWRESLRREMGGRRLCDVAYENRALGIRERLSRDLVPLDPGEGFPPETDLLIYRRTGRTVQPGDRLPELVATYDEINSVRPRFDVRAR